MGYEVRKTQQVTVVITCMTDGERPYVAESLQSVAAQQGVHFSVRLYVAEKNDWIEALLAPFPGVVLRRVPPQPACRVRNLGVSEAESEWIAFLDGDDIWEPEKLAKQLVFAERQDAEFVGADHSLIDIDGRLVAYGLARYIPMTSSWLVRRDVMLENPFPEVPRHEDGAWWLRTLDRVEHRRLPEFLVRYRVRPNSQSSGKRQRKVRLVQVARVPLMAPLLRQGTRGLHYCYRSTYYNRHPAWDKNDVIPARLVRQ